MSLTASLNTPVSTSHGPHPDVILPNPSRLARFLESRLAAEQGQAPSLPLPQGVAADLRPPLPKISMAAVMLYAHRTKVDSFPLIYTTLALAYPN
jgi:hypothetical protein